MLIACWDYQAFFQILCVGQDFAFHLYSDEVAEAQYESRAPQCWEHLEPARVGSVTSVIHGPDSLTA
jgi:hypothetical protein